MISETLVKLGPLVVPVLLAIFTGLFWLALWLLGKGGWWRIPGALILIGLGAEVAPLVWR